MRAATASDDKPIARFSWNAVTAAASIAGRHPKFRPPLIQWLKPQLKENGRTPAEPRACLQRFGVDLVNSHLFSRNWRLLRLKGSIRMEWSLPRRLATPTAFYWLGKRKTHFTKTKLDALLSGHFGESSFSIPEVLRAEIEALSPEQQASFRHFVIWMGTVDVPWPRRYLENIFAPHTPRPEIPMERRTTAE